MQTILIEKILDAKIDDVFAYLADHESYGSFKGIDECTLVKYGDDEKNGVGARRRLKIGAMRLDEDITAFEAPTLMEYRISKSFPLPIDHKLGQIKLTAQGDKTLVEWTSTFSVAWPLVGGFLAKKSRDQFAAGFSSLLRQIEARCA